MGGGEQGGQARTQRNRESAFHHAGVGHSGNAGQPAGQAAAAHPAAVRVLLTPADELQEGSHALQAGGALPALHVSLHMLDVQQATAAAGQGGQGIHTATLRQRCRRERNVA